MGHEYCSLSPFQLAIMADADEEKAQKIAAAKKRVSTSREDWPDQQCGTNSNAGRANEEEEEGRHL